jgi:hypothetical protein
MGNQHNLVFRKWGKSPHLLGHFSPHTLNEASSREQLKGREQNPEETNWQEF